jgi:hypothetical protein
VVFEEAGRIWENIMILSPESTYAWAKQREQELIAVAERERVSAAVRRARRACRQAGRRPSRAGRAGPGCRGAAIAAG